MACERCPEHSGHGARLDALSERIDRLRVVVKGKIGQAAMVMIFLTIFTSLLMQTAAYLQGQNNGETLVRLDERLKNHMMIPEKNNAVYTLEMSK